MNILMAKIITGEDIIADIEDNDDGTTTLNKPVRLIMTPDGAALIPLPPYAKSESLVIKNEHLVFTAEPDDDMYNAYNSKFGSGLVVPGMNIVT